MIEEIFSPIIRFLTLNKDAVKETLPFLKFDLKSWPI